MLSIIADWSQLCMSFTTPSGQGILMCVPVHTCMTIRHI